MRIFQDCSVCFVPVLSPKGIPAKTERRQVQDFVQAALHDVHYRSRKRQTFQFPEMAEGHLRGQRIKDMVDGCVLIVKTEGALTVISKSSIDYIMVGSVQRAGLPATVIQGARLVRQE